MPEPLLGGQALVGEWAADARLWLVRGWTAGPAGTAPVHLGSGIEVDLDVADPGTLVGLSVPAPGGDDPTALSQRQHAILNRLVGPARVTRLLAIGRGGPATRKLDDDTGRMRSREPALDLDPVLGQLALAQLIAEDRTSSLGVRGVAMLEAGAAGRALGRGLGLWNRSAGSTAAGAGLLLTAARGDDLRIPSDVAAAVSALLRRASRSRALDPSTARDLVALARSIDAGRHTGPRQYHAADVPVAAAAAAPMAMDRMAPLEAVGEPVAIDRRALPADLAPAALRAQRREPSEIEVRATGWAGRADGWWARAFAADGSIVAMAPFGARRRDAIARLLVPPTDSLGVTVDVSDTPSRARPSVDLRATEHAIRIGRVAARATRLGDTARATEAWQECARQWAAAGDELRAERARELAEQTRGFPQHAPALLSDHLVRDDS
jgi:hypothetical protein